MQYGLSFDGRDVGDGGPEKKNGESRGFFSSQTTLDRSFRFLRMKFVPGQTNLKIVYARLVSVSMSANDRIQRFTIRLSISPAHNFVPFSSEFAQQNGKMRSFNRRLRTQCRREMHPKVFPLPHSNLLLSQYLYECVWLLRGPFVASLRAVWRYQGV